MIWYMYLIILTCFSVNKIINLNVQYYTFLQILKQHWETKAKELDAKICEISALMKQLPVTSKLGPSSRKRKRISRKQSEPEEQQDLFAKCVAEIQVDFFKTVDGLVIVVQGKCVLFKT